MDAKGSLDELLRVSDEVRTAVIFDRGGEPVASNLPDDEAREVAGIGDAMLAYAEALRDGAQVRQLRAVTSDGEVYVVRRGEKAVVAIALPGSLPGLVQHDLRMALSSLSKRRRKAVANATA
jgi:predicted regulator of Ras-like GTPase activity (Roadblock/LC7/MglB family)